MPFKNDFVFLLPNGDLVEKPFSEDLTPDMINACIEQEVRDVTKLSNYQELRENMLAGKGNVVATTTQVQADHRTSADTLANDVLDGIREAFREDEEVPEEMKKDMEKLADELHDELVVSFLNYIKKSAVVSNKHGKLSAEEVKELAENIDKGMPEIGKRQPQPTPAPQPQQTEPNKELDEVKKHLDTELKKFGDSQSNLIKNMQKQLTKLGKEISEMKPDPKSQEEEE
jgi:hypothetical protein